jgi:hypothetical protein
MKSEQWLSCVRGKITDMDMNPRPHWFAFRLRTMFVVVMVSSIPLAWVAHTLHWIRRRQDAIGLGHLGVVNQSPSMTQKWVSKPRPLNFWIANKLLGMCHGQYLSRYKDSPLTREQAEALFPEAIIEDCGFARGGRFFIPVPFPENTSSSTESND